MHLPDGIFSDTTAGQAILVGGGVAAIAGVGMGLRRMDWERIPEVAVLAAAFFVASLIHVPMPPTSVHPLLIGLLGTLLGWSAFPAIFVGLLLQFVFFQHGGITTLGVNTANFGLPALLGYVILHHGIGRNHSGNRVFVIAFCAGCVPVLVAAAATTMELMAIGQHMQRLAETVFGLHIPVALVEGLLTAYVVRFLIRVKPEMVFPNDERGMMNDE